MHRPRLAAWWRLVVALAALQSLLYLFLGLADGAAERALTRLVAPLSLLALVVGLALAVSMARAGKRLALGAASGVALAFAAAVLLSTPLPLLVGLGLFVPVALTLARPDPLPSALAGSGAALALLTMALAMRDRDPPAPGLRAEDVTGLAAGLLLVVGLAAYAWRARSEPLPPLSRRGRAGVVLAGMALLALSWLIGGYVFTAPLWPAALLLLVAPPLLRWRTHTLGAAVVVAVALAGALPAGTCTLDPWSDAIRPGVPEDADARPERVTLAEIGGSGPRWHSGTGFTGLRVECPAPVLAAGAAWALALVGASLWAVLVPPRPGRV